MYAVTRNHPQLLDMQPSQASRRVARVGVAACAARSRRPRHTDGTVGADVPGRVAIGDEDVEAAACAVVVRRVGEERLQALGSVRRRRRTFGEAT